MDDIEKQSQWVDVIAIFLATVAALAAIAGAMLIGLGQVQATGMSLWPLPGLVLTDWLILGAATLIGTIFTLRSKTIKWLLATWLLTGAFIPLVILGAFSIGAYVLISCVLFLISTLIVSIRRHPKWLDCFASFILGLFVNLGLLLLIINLSHPG